MDDAVAITACDVSIACTDVAYHPTHAVAAALWFHGWSAAALDHEATCRLPPAAPYEPGQFYRRELPCLLRVLELGPRARIVVVDGYVWLAHGAPGLGARLHEAIGGIVVGVSKTRFAGATDAVEVRRGRSRRPLLVSAIGMPAAQAAALVEHMHGPDRVPTLLGRVDALARTG